MVPEVGVVVEEQQYSTSSTGSPEVEWIARRGQCRPLSRRRLIDAVVAAVIDGPLVASFVVTQWGVLWWLFKLIERLRDRKAIEVSSLTRTLTPQNLKDDNCLVVDQSKNETKLATFLSRLDSFSERGKQLLDHDGVFKNKMSATPHTVLNNDYKEHEMLRLEIRKQAKSRGVSTNSLR